MKEKANINDYAQKITEALPRGILLNTNGDKFNAVVIGWGGLGTCWGKTVYTVYVREHRYTKAQIDKTGELTISIPLEKPDAKINKICGLQSGHNIDKVKEAGLTPVDPETNHTPGVLEYPITLECKVLYAQRQDISLLPDDFRNSMYPQDVDSTSLLGNCDPHTA